MNNGYSDKLTIDHLYAHTINRNMRCIEIKKWVARKVINGVVLQVN